MIVFVFQVWRENSKRFISYIPRGDISKTYASTSGLFYHRVSLYDDNSNCRMIDL